MSIGKICVFVKFRLPASFFILHPSSFILHPSSFIFHLSSFILHPSSFILHPSSFILHLSSFILHPSSFPHVVTSTAAHDPPASHRPTRLFPKWSFQRVHSRTDRSAGGRAEAGQHCKDRDSPWKYN